MPKDRDVVQEINSLVEQSLSSQMEDIEYAVGLTVLPQQQGMQPVVVVYLATKGMLLNTTVNATGLVPPYGYTADSIDGIVRQLVEVLLQARSEQAKQADTPSGSGLLLPG